MGFFDSYEREEKRRKYNEAKRWLSEFICKQLMPDGNGRRTGASLMIPAARFPPALSSIPVIHQPGPLRAKKAAPEDPQPDFRSPRRLASRTSVDLLIPVMRPTSLKL